MNNDDMDELFRDAAKRYPLKTDGVADWDKVSGALRTDAGIPFADAAEFKKEKKRRVFLWWILLLPLGWIGHESWQKLNGGNEKKMVSVAKVADVETKNATTEKTIKENSSNLNDEKKEAVTDNKIANNTLAIAQKADNKNNVAVSTNQKSKNLRSEGFVANKNIHSKNIFNTQKTETEKNIAKAVIKNANDDKQKIADKTINKNNQEGHAETDKKEDALKNNVANTPVQKNDDALKSTAKKEYNVVTKQTTNPMPEAVAGKKAAKTAVKLKKDFHFYAALMVGADISTVKMQSVKGVGGSVGLLLGYHFSRSRFNIETGIYWDTKKYYSAGEYFNKSKLPPGWQSENLLYVNGNCNMFEIPINVRYNFIQHKATTFFATAGLSSYIMNKEAYSYRLVDNSGWAWDGDKSYYHSTQNWFSILNLSAGYEHHLGKIGDIRIEPYAKLPLSGIGLGSLSLSSLGLNVGLSKRF
ncbi:MAG TPA: hypothetical protein VKT28_20730 [Puia sp.]|nr:hypothetical protein [Puia sp.]